MSGSLIRKYTNGDFNVLVLGKKVGRKTRRIMKVKIRNMIWKDLKGALLFILFYFILKRGIQISHKKKKYNVTSSLGAVLSLDFHFFLVML